MAKKTAADYIKERKSALGMDAPENKGGMSAEEYIAQRKATKALNEVSMTAPAVTKPSAKAPEKPTNSPRSAGAGFAVGTIKPAAIDGKKVTGKAADSGTTAALRRTQQQANRETATKWGKILAEDTKNSFQGLKNDGETQRKLALERKMGEGESWGSPKRAIGNVIESAGAGSVASYMNALGTALVDDRKHGKAVDSGEMSTETTGDEWHNRWGTYLQDEADKVQQISDAAYQRGTEKLNTAEKMLFDAGVAGAQMLGDMATGAAPYAMAIRGFGGGAMQARQDGGTHTQQVLYGAASAAVEALTEKMFDGVAKIYGKGMADDVVEAFAKKVANSETGQAFVRALVGMGGEGLEEVISGVVDPALQTIYNGKSMGESYSELDAAELLYEGAIGALLGGFGGSVEIAQAVNNGRKNSPAVAERGTALEATEPAAPAQQESKPAAPAQQAEPAQQTAEQQRESEEVERIIEAFTADDGRVDAAKQQMLLDYHGEELFYRAVTEAFRRGEITSDGAGNIYSLRAEEKRPGYYGPKSKEAKYLDAMAKAAGMTIHRGDLPGGEMGYYINGRAVLAEDAGVEIARHEVAHHLKQVAPEEFNAFLDYAKGVYGSKVDEALETIRGSYAERGEALSDAVAEEELAAYFAGQLMTDETAMRRLAGENLSLAERLLDWIRKSLAKVGRALGMESTEAKQLREGAALFENAIRAAKGGTVETDGVVRHAIGEIEGKNGSYGIGVILDTKIFGKKHPRDWGPILKDFVYKNLAGKEVTVYDENGTPETICFARKNDRVRKDGAKNNHKAIDKLAGYRNDSIRALATVHLSEALMVPFTETTSDEHRHQWMDEKGWVYRTVVLQGMDGKIYEAMLNIADGRDRRLLYDITNIREIDRKKETTRGIVPSTENGRGLHTKGGYGDSVPDSAEKSNTNSSGKRSAYEDTAEQLKDIQRLQRQNERLQEQIFQLRGNLQAAGRGTDRESVKVQAKDLKKRYGSRVNTNELTDSIVALYDDMSANTISNEEMRQRASEIAQKVLDGAAQQINPLYEEYEELRKTLRSRRIHLSEADRADLDHVGGYNAMRQKNMGRLMLAKDGVGVDVLYEELSEDYPELFPDDVYSPADQLIRISDVLDDLAAVEGNPFEQTPGARDFLAGDILERFFGTPQTYKAELQRDRAAAEKRLEKEREKYRQRLAAVEKTHAEEDRVRRARATATERREQLMKGTERLTKKLVRPDDKRHIPAEMRETVRAFVSMVNTESGYEYVFQRDGTYKRVKAGSDPFGMATTRTDRARELQAQLRKLEEDSGATIDPQLQANLDEIAEMQETKIADMNRQQLDLVYETMRTIEKMCQNHDKMLGESKYATVSKAAEALRAANSERAAKTQWKGALQALDDLAELDMMTPETFFHKMGKPGDELWRQMRRSADKQTSIVAEGVEHAKKAIEKSGLDLKKLERETHEFELESGEKLTMTTAQIMELHALWKREQAREHILEYGGIKPSKIDAGKGLKATAAVRAEKVTLGDLAKIMGVLTDEQRKLVESLQKFMAGGLAKHGNEASRTVYGYDKFTEPNYWPIHVNKAEVETDPSKAAAAKTIVGFGMAKATKPKAKNGLEIGSFLDTYTKHLSEMATYAGWLATSENLTRINNFKFLDGQSNPTGETVKTVLEKIYGRGGDAYWQKLMGDIAQGTKAGSDGTIMDKITGNTKAAAVGANLRVILQQPTSILRAMNIVHPKYFTQKGNGNGWEKALKYSGIAQWKDWGYFEMDTGRSVRGLITGPETKVEQLREASMAAAGKADSVSWGILWNAVENETRDKHPELAGEALYEATAERFGEVIDRTQVVDSVLHRSQIMRKGGINKMATSFMSEPSKIYNMMLRDIYDVSAAKGEQAQKVAKKKLARTAGTLVLSFAANAVAQSVVDAMRDDDREKEYWEKFLENWGTNFADNFNALNYIPYVKDIVSVFSGYDVSRMDMDAIADAKQAADQLAKAIKGTGKKTVVNAGFDAAAEIGGIFGLPVANVKRDLLAAVNTAFSEARLYRMQYELDKVLYNIDYTGSRVRWWKILYAASKDNWDDYEAIYYDMIESGIPEEKIKAGIENQMKEDYGVKSVKELPSRWTPPNERSKFNSMSKQLCEIEGPKKALDLGWW